MFGFPTFNKLLVLVGVIVAIWYAAKLIGQLDRQRRAEAKAAAQTSSGKSGARIWPWSRKAPASDVQDMAKCERCGAFVVARKAGRCERADCPN